MAAKKGRRTLVQDIKLNEITECDAAFTLPDSLPCSEVSFPVLTHRRTKANWDAILEENRLKMQTIENFVESKNEPPIKSPFQRTECDYIKTEVFTLLLPALEETLNKAKMWNALQNTRCFFNGIDWIVQLLWNNNPRHPDRKEKNLHLFNMPWVKNHLAEHPRPYYPKSWLWPEDYAATLIQKTLRQYFVQRDEEVQEMREFWRKLDMEREMPDMEINPMLARKFASERRFSQHEPKPQHDDKLRREKDKRAIQDK